MHGMDKLVCTMGVLVTPIKQFCLITYKCHTHEDKSRCWNILELIFLSSLQSLVLLYTAVGEYYTRTLKIQRTHVFPSYQLHTIKTRRWEL